MFDFERNKQDQKALCNKIRRIWNEIMKKLAKKIKTLARKAYSLITHDHKKNENDRNSNHKFNTTITKNCNEKESITLIIDPRTR